MRFSAKPASRFDCGAHPLSLASKTVTYWFSLFLEIVPVLPPGVDSSLVRGGIPSGRSH